MLISYRALFQVGERMQQPKRMLLPIPKSTKSIFQPEMYSACQDIDAEPARTVVLATDIEPAASPPVRLELQALRG